MRRLWLTLAMLALGAGAIVSTGHAQPDRMRPLREGGTLRVNLPETDIDDIDPSIAYGTTSWGIEYSTALKLVNYPDAPAPLGSRLMPEGASSYVSRDGKTYTFTIRKGFEFSDGAPVTARNYAFAINRALGRDLQSPGFQFIADSWGGVNIVGAVAVRDGTAETASGVRVYGNKLIVTLTKPDATFLAKISMPFFQAMPLGLSRTDKMYRVDSDHPLPSAGPYYVSYREPNRLVTLEQNPFYARNVSSAYPRRPRRLATIGIRTNVNLDQSYLEVRENQADSTLDPPSTAAEELEEEFGLNDRFRIRPTNCVSFIAMNTSNPLFRDNPQLRQAVNYAIDREAMVDLSGEYVALPTDQYLPSGFPGFDDIAAYPSRPDMDKARRLAEGHVPGGGPWKYFFSLYTPGIERMELVRRQLSQIGIEIDPQGSRGYWIWDAAGKRNSPHAFVTAGWCQDYPDPYDFINVLLYGGTIQEENNNNVSYFDDPTYNRRMVRAAKLVGAARLRAYAALEHDLVTKAAPWAAWSQPANQFFFSGSVDMRSFVYQPIYETPPYNLLALK